MVLTRTEIQEIHTALSESFTLGITEPLFITEEKAQLMLQTGFYGHPDVKKYVRNTKITEKNNLVNNIRSLGYNVVERVSLNRVARKYNLIEGTIDRYIGDVPMKNLREIKGFLEKVKTEQVLKDNIKNAVCKAFYEDGTPASSCLFILAPQDMFQENPINKDPIVYAVLNNGGIVIVSKWGLEANDQSISNPINN
jgi:hypothetical protein